MRKCVEEIIRSKGIRKFEDFDFQTLRNLKMGAGEISEIIDSVWLEDENPYTKQISKWMGEATKFDPCGGKSDGWAKPAEILYSNLNVDYFKGDGSAFFVRSDIEMWHVLRRSLSGSNNTPNYIFSVATSVAIAPTRWFGCIRASRTNTFLEIDVSKVVELRKKRTVLGAISSTQVTHLLSLERKPVEGDVLKLLEKIMQS